MGAAYFKDLHTKSDTRFWINNPTLAEMELSLNNDVFSCTTNPAYCSRLLSTELDYINAVIDAEIVKKKNYDDIAIAVYRTCGKRLMDASLPVFEASSGEKGFVTIQDDPRFDQDAEHTIACIMENRKLAPNYMAKIPVVKGGIEAIEACVQYNIPVCATEVFAVAQALRIAEAYEAAAEKFGNRPAMYITHITGIYDEYLKKLNKRHDLGVPEELIDKAGLAVARRQYHVLKEHGFNFVMLGGGARSMHHFTGLVGGPHITINWSTAKEIMDADIPIRESISEKTPEAVVDQLFEKFIDFRKAYADNGLTTDEFADFGPVQLFRNAFLKGWYHLLMHIASRKHENAI